MCSMVQESKVFAGGRREPQTRQRGLSSKCCKTQQVPIWPAWAVMGCLQPFAAARLLAHSRISIEARQIKSK